MYVNQAGREIRTIEIEENGIYTVLGILDDGIIRLLHFSSIPFCGNDLDAEDIREGFPLVGFSLSGYDRPYERHGNKYIVTAPGYRLKYCSHTDQYNDCLLYTSPSPRDA